MGSGDRFEHLFELSFALKARLFGALLVGDVAGHTGRPDDRAIRRKQGRLVGFHPSRSRHRLQSFFDDSLGARGDDHGVVGAVRGGLFQGPHVEVGLADERVGRRLSAREGEGPIGREEPTVAILEPRQMRLIVEQRLQREPALFQRLGLLFGLCYVGEDRCEHPGSNPSHRDTERALERCKVGLEVLARAAQRHLGVLVQEGRDPAFVDDRSQFSRGLGTSDARVALELGVDVENAIVRWATVRVAQQLVEGDSFLHVLEEGGKLGRHRGLGVAGAIALF